MALTIYPAVGYDSFISEADATAYITNNNVNNATWLALTVAEREIYLRIAMTRILNVISTDNTNTNGYLDESTYVAGDSCLPNVNAIMAMYDLEYGISKDINPNLGTIIREKVDGLEVEYQNSKYANGRRTNPFPASIRSCLSEYGAVLRSSGFYQATLTRS